jgi:uroporphyrinogen-III decarboxylase
MKHKVIETLLEKNDRMISLIGGKYKAFEFMCWHYIDFAESLGFELYQDTHFLKKVREDSILNQKALDEIQKRNYFNELRFKEELNNMEKLKQKTKLSVGGGCFGPLTVAASILGVERINRLSLTNAQFVENTVDYVTSHMIRLAKEESKLGMDFFWIAEPLASLFSPRVFEKFCGKYLKKIFDSIEEPGYLHVCGKTIRHTEHMVATGAEVLSIDYCTDIYDSMRLVPPDVIIMGNINPMLLKEGKKEEIEVEVKKINEACKNYKNFIFSTGCSIPEETPEENIFAAVKATQEFRIYQKDTYKEIREYIKKIQSGNTLGVDKFSKSYKIAEYEASEIERIQRRYKYGKYKFKKS